MAKGVLQDSSELRLAETCCKSKPLCFQTFAYQKTHPAKAFKGSRDADATLEAPLILGVADGISQVEDFGIDSSALPNELLGKCEELGMCQLMPESTGALRGDYQGLIPLVREAFQSSESLGSTTLALAVLDNVTRMHGELRPTIAVISVGDCEVVVLRRTEGRMSPFRPVFHTEIQRLNGHAQTPLQLVRVDERIDPCFHEGITVDVIEKRSAVHCIAAQEGDLLVLGSDGVFDNLFIKEVADLCNATLPPSLESVQEACLGRLAKGIVEASHAKTCPGPGGQQAVAPIGIGGKVDDTACVVAEVVPWTEERGAAWAGPCEQAVSRKLWWRNAWWWELFACGASCRGSADVSADVCCDDEAIFVEVQA
mmetsp:Transcript_60679/g.130290  ORF Transcript_60679/g.130290 Transcript_60679/m.130290 type:complete len:369 (-) Transcript_60679:123-1229(-)